MKSGNGISYHEALVEEETVITVIVESVEPFDVVMKKLHFHHQPFSGMYHVIYLREGEERLFDEEREVILLFAGERPTFRSGSRGKIRFFSPSIVLAYSFSSGNGKEVYVCADDSQISSALRSRYDYFPKQTRRLERNQGSSAPEQTCSEVAF